MNAYKFNATILDNGMIFFPFHTEFSTKEVEVIVIPKIDEDKTVETGSVKSSALLGKRPSDFIGTLSAEDGEKFHQHVNNSRLEWERTV
ncbi:MAG: hypothetical protein LBV41_09680 [Cytophagaceae bacterium]|nr:hypothetical protein [Cytophagaceae bacterium]